MADLNGQDTTRGRAYLKLALFGLVIVGGFLLARHTPLASLLTQEGLTRTLGELRGSVWAPVLFVSVYAGATALAIPGTILTLAGGAIFGFFWGTALNTIAANIGASAAFFVARFLGREGVERIGGRRLDQLDAAAKEHGFQGLLVLRLVPLVPFNALNFGSGLTALRWRTYALATVIGIFPGTVVYTMFADALLQGSQEASRDAWVRVLISGGLLVFLSFLPKIMKKLNLKMPGLSRLLLCFAVLPAAVSGQARDALPDPSAFTAVLEDVVKAPLVDYAALQANRQGLDAYLEDLAGTDPEALSRASRSARLAFWINAYNACMLRLVIDHYPLKKDTRLLSRATNAFLDRPDNSVWQISDVFTREHCSVAGEARSQDQIEHEIIRPMGEPRIHFAVNCAAISCPPIQAWAFTADELDRQLDRVVRGFIADSQHFRLERGERSVLRLNKVLEWYGDDFGGAAGLRDFFGSYLQTNGADSGIDDGTAVEFFEYDWTLNDIQR